MKLKNISAALLMVTLSCSPLYADSKITKEEKSDLIDDVKTLGKVVLFGGLSALCYTHYAELIKGSVNQFTGNINLTPVQKGILGAWQSKVFLPVLGALAMYVGARVLGKTKSVKASDCEEKPSVFDRSRIVGHEQHGGGCC